MRKLKIEKGGNYSLSHEHKEVIQIIFHKSMNLIISSILNINNNDNNNYDNNNNINNNPLYFIVPNVTQ